MELATALLPILVTLLAAVLAYWRYTVEIGHQRDALLNALFGELGNLLEHYTYANSELPTAGSPELTKRLRWSAYGELYFTKDLSRYGFLDAGDIQELLQLGLRVRNTDHLCRMYLASLETPGQESPSQADLDTLKRRMRYAINSANGLLTVLVDKKPKLQQTLNSMRDQLSEVY